MRVLQVVHGFPPGSTGGTEVYAHDLSRALGRRPGVEVFVLAREANPGLPEYHVREEARDGLGLTFVNNTFAASRSFEDSYRQPAIREVAAALLDRVRPDVVHVHHLTGLSTDIPAECSRRGIPVVLTLHDYWLICHRGQLLDERYERCEGPWPSGCSACVGAAGAVGAASYAAATGLRRLGVPVPSPTGPLARAVLAARGSGPGAGASLARLDHMREACSHVSQFLAPSRTVLERFLPFGLPAEKFVPHELGIDLSGFARIERTPSERLRIGFLGSLMVSKAPHLLLEAFTRLPPGSATLHLHGAHAAYHGDDGYRTRLEPLLHAPGVHWAGPVPHERVPGLLASLDVLVVPSVWLENSPLVIREAFAAGVPVVASRLGGMAEMVVHERSGLLFEPGSSEDLSRALSRLVDEPELLPRLRRGIPPVRAIDDDADATLARYRSLVAADGPGPRPLAAVVLNYGTPQATARAVESLAASHRPLSAILVVDNGSGDGAADALRAALPAATILASEHNLGFSGGCNLGIAEALRLGAGLVLLVNSDAVLAPDAVRRMEEALLADERHGIVVPVLVSSDEPTRITSAGIAFSTRTGRMRHHRFGEPYDPARVSGRTVVDAGSGCVMLVRREVFERIGDFDASYFFSFEDVDFCVRASRAGFLTVVASDALAHHVGSLTIGARSPRKLYFSTRNHLRAAGRRSGEGSRVAAALRGAWIVALSAAYALRGSGAPRLEGLQAVALGTWHHLRGRYDDGP